MSEPVPPIPEPARKPKRFNRGFEKPHKRKPKKKPAGTADTGMPLLPAVAGYADETADPVGLISEAQLTPSPPPRNWERRVMFAFLRSLGWSVPRCVKQLGLARRTLQLWAADPTWPRARELAKRRWYAHAEDVARGTIVTAMEGGDAATARWLLERMDDKLRPPDQQREGVMGAEAMGVGVQVTTSTTPGGDQTTTILLARLAAMANRPKPPEDAPEKKS